MPGMLRHLFIPFLGLLLGTAIALPAAAWPERPVRLVVGAAPGGSNDLVARLLADEPRHTGWEFRDGRGQAGRWWDFPQSAAGYRVVAG